MSVLYISEFDEDGIKKYGLFYDDSSGKRCQHSENFKYIVYDYMVEAQNKLDSLAAERIREDKAVAFTIDEAKEFAESHKWKFATTYAKTAPHEYLVKSWLSEEEKIGYERFVAAMKANSVVGYFYGHKNNYFILGDYYYWFMGQHDNMAVDLINRTTIDYLEYKDGAYFYKGREDDKKL